MIIGIDMGHPINAGASNLLNETTENRKIGTKVIELLKSKGHTVVNCTVDQNVNELAQRVAKANAQKLDVFVSIHLNAGGGHGTETYIYNESYNGKENNRAIAKSVNDKIVNSCNFRNRGVKEGNYYVLRETIAPAILIEVCFVDSAEDKGKLNTDKVAIAICEGLTGQSYNQATTPGTNAAGEMYRVRKSWTDISSQKGAFSDLNNAKKCCDQNPGYSVFNSAGAKVYPGAAATIGIGSKVKVIGTNYATGQTIPAWVKNNTYTVVELGSNKALLSPINSWVYLTDLKLV